MENELTQDSRLNTQDQKPGLKKLLRSPGFKIFLVVLVVGLSLFGFTIKKDSEKKKAPLQGGPTPTLPYIERQQKKMQAITELPFVSDKFDIEYFPSDDTFFVQIKQNPYEGNKGLVLQWFRDHGVDPQNIEIEWTSVRGVL